MPARCSICSPASPACRSSLPRRSCRRASLRLLGPTGGYLMSYPFAAFVAGWLAERGFDRRYLTSVLAMARRPRRHLRRAASPGWRSSRAPPVGLSTALRSGSIRSSASTSSRFSSRRPFCHRSGAADRSVLIRRTNGSYDALRSDRRTSTRASDPPVPAMHPASTSTSRLRSSVSNIRHQLSSAHLTYPRLLSLSIIS